MIFFEILGKVQWYLIGFMVLAGAYFTMKGTVGFASEISTSKNGSADGEKAHKALFTMWVVIIVASIAIIICGSVVPNLAQRGGDEVGGTLSLPTSAVAIDGPATWTAAA